MERITRSKQLEWRDLQTLMDMGDTVVTAQALYNQAMTGFFLTENPSRAFGVLRTAILMSPDSLEFRASFAMLCRCLSRVTEAVKLWELVENKSVKNDNLQYCIAEGYSELGKADDAIEIWKKLVEGNPSDWNLQWQLAEAFAKKAEHDKTIEI